MAHTLPLSTAEENYLKAIYALAHPRVSTNALADRVQTKASSATDMIQRLSEKNLVDYEKYRGVALTPEGLFLATSIVRRHRLWEVFLSEKLGFPWGAIHALAEELEHIKSQELIDRLDSYLGFPTHDPHGDPIPQADGSIPETRRTLLDRMETGQRFKIVGVIDQSDFLLDFLSENGLLLDSEWILDRIILFDGSCVLLSPSGLPSVTISALAARHIYAQNI